VIPCYVIEKCIFLYISITCLGAMYLVCIHIKEEGLLMENVYKSEQGGITKTKMHLSVFYPKGNVFLSKHNNSICFYVCKHFLKKTIHMRLWGQLMKSTSLTLKGALKAFWSKFLVDNNFVNFCDFFKNQTKSLII